MITKITPNRDSTIYAYYPEANAGKDAILELTYGGSTLTDPSRMLLYFATSKIQQKTASLGATGVDYQLYLYSAQTEQASDEIEIELRAVSRSWDEGYGEINMNPQLTASVSWNARRSNVSWSNAGGDYYTSSYTQSVTLATRADSGDDLSFNVTPLVNAWLSGSLDNNGVLIKFATESNPENPISLKYFSANTSTIYSPVLIIKWNDYSYNSGSLSSLNLESTQSYIRFYNLKDKYKNDEFTRIKFRPYPLYPTLTYYTSSVTQSNYHLGTSSFYEIIDYRTKELLTFNTVYTKVSCDGDYNYFDFDMNFLAPNRYYKIIIKSNISGSNRDYYFDDDWIFYVTND